MVVADFLTALRNNLLPVNVFMTLFAHWFDDTLILLILINGKHATCVIVL